MHFIFLVSPSPPDDPLSTDSSELSTNGEKSATTSISTNKIKKPKEKKEDPEVIRKWKEQQVILLVGKIIPFLKFYTFISLIDL